MTGINVSVAPEITWEAVSVSEVGESHLVMTPPLPCQDASFATGSGRPLAIVADGLGSKPLSHIGADAVVRQVPCYLAGIEETLAKILDYPPSGAEEGDWCQGMGRGIVRFAAAVLEDLGRQMGHDAGVFQSTLLLVITGTVKTFWMQVGDGSVVFERGEAGLVTVCPQVPGQPADLTVTIRNALTLPQIPCGLVPSHSLTGIAVFSDGTGERLIAQDGRKVAPILQRFLQAMRIKQARRPEVLDFLRDRQIWSKTSRDDRSLTMLARTG
jgi:hypothetical protein